MRHSANGQRLVERKVGTFFFPANIYSHFLLSRSQLSQADRNRTEESLRSAHGSQSLNSQLIQPPQPSFSTTLPCRDELSRKRAVSYVSKCSNIELWSASIMIFQITFHIVCYIAANVKGLQRSKCTINGVIVWNDSWVIPALLNAKTYVWKWLA